MGLIENVLGFVFGSNRNVVRETVEVFRENSEKRARRDQDLQLASLAQFATEFAAPQKSWFDRCVDGLNRLPRPAMALGTIGLFAAAMADPVWFAERMRGIALVPEPLWWLLGAIVSFYFGARHQLKGQEFQRSLAQSLARLPAPASPAPKRQPAAVKKPKREDPFAENAALKAWQATRTQA